MKKYITLTCLLMIFVGIPVGIAAYYSKQYMWDRVVFPNEEISLADYITLQDASKRCPFVAAPVSEIIKNKGIINNADFVNYIVAPMKNCNEQLKYNEDRRNKDKIIQGLK